MKQAYSFATILLALTIGVAAQTTPVPTKSEAPGTAVANTSKVAKAEPAPAPRSAKSEGQATKPAPAAANKLDEVLNAMDKTAASFQSLEADFEWDQYSKVVDETTVQKGVMYFRRQGKDIEMAADIRSTDGRPDAKHVLFTGGNVQVYQPKVDQITKYNAGKNKADFESFLVLGFGGRGHDLAKSFEVRYAGDESIGGINTAKLELTPKVARVKNLFELITLWIDPVRGISVQQKFQESSGDYRLAKYSNVKMNQKLPDSAFKLKTTGKTKVVTPQG